MNAGRTTNFIYNVKGLETQHIARINAIETRTKIIDRMQAISGYGGQLAFEKMENETFRDNLIMIDSQRPFFVDKSASICYISINRAECVQLSRIGFPKDFQRLLNNEIE